MLPTKYKLFLSIYLSHSNINGFIAVFFSVTISFESIIHLKNCTFKSFPGEKRGLVGPFSIRRLVIMSVGHAINKDFTEDIENERNEVYLNILISNKIFTGFN